VIADWDPQALALTHFSAYADVAHHLAAVEESLASLSQRPRRLDADAFRDALEREVRAAGSAATAEAYALAAPLEHQYHGLRRALNRRTPAPSNRNEPV
jgi:hypothetical protein